MTAWVLPLASIVATVVAESVVGSVSISSERGQPVVLGRQVRVLDVPGSLVGFDQGGPQPFVPMPGTDADPLPRALVVARSPDRSWPKKPVGRSWQSQPVSSLHPADQRPEPHPAAPEFPLALWF
jgi:hypothetical protein